MINSKNIQNFCVNMQASSKSAHKKQSVKTYFNTFELFYNVVIQIYNNNELLNKNVK